jgi:anti-sigma B factor antagonist
MALEIVEKDSGGITVLELSGQVVLGGEANQLSKKIKESIDKGQKRLILDVAQVRHVDSAGLGMLVAAYTAARGQGASLKLARTTERLNLLLTITKLVTIFESYPSVEEALKSFG